MSAIPWDAIGIGSGWALVTLFVVLIYKGRLVPRSTYDDQVHQTDQWRAECRFKDQQLGDQGEQIQTLLHEVAPTLTHFLQDMRQVAEKDTR